MFSEYVRKKMSQAKYKLLKNDSYFGEIPGLKGVWANAENLEDCRRQLQEVLEDWLVLKIRDNDRIPGFVVSFNRKALAKYA